MAGSYLIIFLALLISPGIKSELLSSEIRQESCISCHNILVNNTVVHPELATTCDICHTSTGKEHPDKSVKGFTLSEKLPVLCFNCHSDFQEHIDSYASVHSPLKDGASCLNCHNPHSSPENKLLISSPNDLCFVCHNKTIVKDSVRIRNISQILQKAKSVHPPVESGGCTNCHNPHFAENRALLIGKFPKEQYVKATAETFELCFMCHDKDLLEKQTTEAATNFRNGTKNLHFVHVSGDKGRNCIMCHDVHGAVNERLIIDKLKFGSWDMKISFSASEKGGSCLTACHSERQYDRTIAAQMVPKVATTESKSARQTNPGQLPPEKAVNGEPKNSQVTANVFYTIQLNAAKERLNMNKYKSINGVREIKSSDGYYRYIYGDYSSISKAKPDLELIHNSGFRDAFIKELKISERK